MTPTLTIQDLWFAIPLAFMAFLIIGSVLQSILRATLKTYRKCKGGCAWHIQNEQHYSTEGNVTAVRHVMFCRRCGETQNIVHETPRPETDQ